VKKHLWYVRPGYLAVIGGVLAAFMVTAALLEARNTRDTMLELIAEKGRIVANQIEQGAVLAMRAMKEAEENLASRLLTVARTVARMEEGRELGHPVLAALAAENGIEALHIVSPTGRIQASSQPSEHFLNRPPPDYFTLYPTLFEGEGTESILGLHYSAVGGKARFAVGVRRRGGGAVICSVDAKVLLDLRKTFGLGRLIQDVGEVHGMSYVMIQDEEGILTATRNVSGA
jgi:hypothetical protein